MDWAQDPSTSHASESNDVIERQNGLVYDGLRTCLERAGFASQLWPLAGEYFCDATSIGVRDPTVEHGLDKDCPYFRRFHRVWAWHRVPFGALVEFSPNADWQRKNVPKAGTRTEPGIVLGYSFQDGGRFRKKYRVCPLADC